MEDAGVNMAVLADEWAGVNRSGCCSAELVERVCSSSDYCFLVILKAQYIHTYIHVYTGSSCRVTRALQTILLEVYNDLCT